MAHVLLIEDDAEIQDVVQRGLGARGFVVSSVRDGVTGTDFVRKFSVDLVLLDLRLPGKQGLEVLEELRAARPRLPVIALTALDDTDSKIRGLNAGADDYVTKPFSIEELSARIRARLRWTGQDGLMVQAGPLTLDLASHRATISEREVPLSAREFELLAAFVQHTGQLLSRQQLLRLVWGVDFDPGSNLVEVYVSALRRKLDERLIETVRGVGYRFVVPAGSPAAPGAAQ